MYIKNCNLTFLHLNIVDYNFIGIQGVHAYTHTQGERELYPAEPREGDKPPTEGGPTRPGYYSGAPWG